MTKERKSSAERSLLVFIGTRTQSGSRGIYSLRLDPASGRLSAPVLAAESVNPTFLALHPNRRFLYAVGEISDPAGQSGGGLRAFAIGPEPGRLTPLNQAPSGGAGPCHLTVDATGRCLLAANYRSGSVAALAIRPDGRLTEPATVLQHAGAGIHPVRQQGPHAHSVNLDPANRLALVADLGLDKLMVYRLDPARAALTPHEPAFVPFPPGSGPRHLAWHPDGTRAYVCNELNNTVSALDFEPDPGRFTLRQSVGMLPALFKGESLAAEIRVHPAGRFLYASNRGHDSLAVFAISPSDGTLTLAAVQPCGGAWPRHFALDPSGAWLLAAHERSDTLRLFRVDPDNGHLEPAGDPVPVPAPLCVLFYAPLAAPGGQP